MSLLAPGVALWLALAADPAGGAPLQAAAVDALARGEFELALSILDRAAAQPVDRTALAEIHLIRAEIYAALGEQARIDEAFIQALEKDPDARLDPERAAPELITRLDEVRRSLRGELQVEASVEGAALQLDGAPLGVAPYRGQVPIGTHTLQVTASAGTPPVQMEIRIHPGQTHAVRVALPPRSPSPPVAAAASPGSPAVEVTLQARAVTSLQLGAGGEVGVGFLRNWLMGELGLTAGSRFGVAARVGVLGPTLAGRIRPRLSLDGFLVTGGGALPGAGASAGIEVALSPRWDAFVDVSGRWLAASPVFETWRWLGAAGVRLRVGSIGGER